ncbi:MAG: Hint domain-containing protein [Alphaproteobacteria bacterium]|nr:Hint domain-containing protein [Alphaproteobacteria bacterium]
MAVAFGFVPGTRIATPDGPVPIEALTPGDVVWAWDPSEPAPTRATVVQAPRTPARHLVAIDLGTARLAGLTPGTYVWDAFEEIFRGASSLSTLAELLVGDADGLVATPVVEVPERQVDTPIEVVHLGLDRAGATFLADGVLVRHLEAT